MGFLLYLEAPWLSHPVKMTGPLALAASAAAAKPAALSWSGTGPPSARALTESHASPWRAHVPKQPAPSPPLSSDQNQPDVGGVAGGGLVGGALGGGEGGGLGGGVKGGGGGWLGGGLGGGGLGGGLGAIVHVAS